MCQKKDTFIFCTCQDPIENSSNSNILNHYTWTLTRLLSQNRLVKGKIVAPKNDLGEGLKIETIIEQLNNNQSNFDFDYSPSENDCLKIVANIPDERWKYFRVSYQNGRWQKGSFFPPSMNTENIAEGKIKKEN